MDSAMADDVNTPALDAVLKTVHGILPGMRLDAFAELKNLRATASSLQAERDRLRAALTALANVADHATTVLRYPQPRMCEMHAVALGRAVREARSLLPAALRPAGEGITEAPPTGD